MRTIEASVKVRVSPQVLWTAITDSSALPKHVAMLTSVHLLSENLHVGAVRVCTLKSGRSFHEQITVWEPGHRYCYKPDVEAAGFPFKEAEACWTVEAKTGGSTLSYRLQYEPKSRGKDLLNYPLLRTYGVWQIRKMLQSYDA
jgi:ribosome-associated toxin RatA of RatAB toxin-antitoxin module